MTKILIHLDKSIEENAGIYFDKAKRIRKKIEGAREALKQSEKKLKKLQEQVDTEKLELEEKKQAKKRKKDWFEKFRWFRSSTGFLVIGGRDATSNEIVIKKHTDSNDVVFHTDMAGSPFFVVKTEGQEVDKETIREVSDATCSFSRAWKLGLSTTSVFYVNPDQVSKKAQSGEYMNKGSFMIYGKVNYSDNQVNCGVGMDSDGRIMSGPLSAVQAHCESFVEIIQGDEKTSSVAKAIQKKIGGVLDDIVRAMPAGGCRLRKK